MDSPKKPPQLELSPTQRHRQALALMGLGLLGTLSGQLAREGWHSLLHWRWVAGTALLAMGLYAFWRWAIRVCLTMAQSLAAQRARHRRPAA